MTVDQQLRCDLITVFVSNVGYTDDASVMSRVLRSVRLSLRRFTLHVGTTLDAVRIQGRKRFVTDNQASYYERTTKTAALVDQLHAIVNELETLHPGRRFPLDGHLVGSIGEAAAEALFALELVPASSPGHDAIADDGQTVEIKATYGNRNVAMRATSRDAAGALIVLRLSRRSTIPHEVVYNGSLARVLHSAGRAQKNGQESLLLSRLRQLDTEVPDGERVQRR